MKRRIAAISILITLAACGGSSGPTPGARPSSPAVVGIDQPSNSDIVKGPNVQLVLRLENARIIAQTSKNIRPDEGHLHIYLDQKLVSGTGGFRQTVPNVTPGEHIIRVEFVAADHAAFDPRVQTAVIFTVQ